MKKKKKGYSLALVMLVSSILLFLLAVSGTIIMSEAKQTIVQEKRTQAHYIARAGAASTAKWITSMSPVELQNFNSLTFPVYSEPQSFNEGTFQININKDAQLLNIESTGKVSNGKNSDGSIAYVTDTATMVLQKSDSSMGAFDTAIYSNGDISISRGPNVTGNIRTNSSAKGAITFEGGYTLTGKVYIPLGSKVNDEIRLIGGAIMPNQVEQSDGIRSYPPPILPQFPEGLPNMGNLTVKSWPAPQPISGHGYYDRITVKENVTFVINITDGENILRIKNLDVQQGHVKINGTGKLKIYVDNLISLKGSLNNNGDEKQVELYCKDTFNIGNETAVYGSIYLGNQDVSISNGAKIVGDIITSGSSVTISGGVYANPKVIYAPNATINVIQGATINGAIIGNIINISGGTTVKMSNSSIESKIPIQTGSSNGSGYETSYWK